MRERNTNALAFLKTVLELCMNDVWENPDFTPQEVFNGFGTDASQLFTSAQKLIEIITLEDPDYVPPSPTKPYTINEDGTVTITV